MKKLLGIIILSWLLTGCGGALPPPPGVDPTASMTYTFTPSPTPTPTPTATPTPTIDFLATYTYTIPISATLTPSNTPTPDACDQQQLTAYREQVTQIRDEFLNQVDRALALQESIANAVIPNISEIAEIGTIYLRMTELVAEAQGLDYPPCAEPAQNKLIEGLSSYTGAILEVADYYAGKGGNLDSVDAMLAAGRRLLQESMDELDSLVE